MKLVIVTSVEAFRKDVLRLFKNANIHNLSSSDIDGYKNGSSVLMTTGWFASEKYSNESRLFFSFTDDENIDKLFDAIAEFNSGVETNNAVRAVVAPIERHI